MRKNIISIILLSACLSLHGQGSGPQVSGNDPSVLPKILPSSPEAYKLGSFGNIPVSLFTGTANVSIPLAAFETKKLSLDITMNYASNGIQIDNMNGSTGLGWSLVTGGVITRTIRDLPDEDNTNITFPSNIDSLGIRHPIVMQYLQDASNELVDSEQDLYMANFNGNQVQFVFDRRGAPIVYSQKDIVIEGESGGNSFTITMDDGIKYYFTDTENTSNRTLGDGHSLLSNNITAWYLTKIEDPSSNEQILIENQNASYSTTLTKSQIMRYTIGPAQQSTCGGPAFYLPPTISELISHLQTVNGKQIKRIYSNNPAYGQIIFDYSNSNGNEDYQKLVRIQKTINAQTISDINFDYTLTGNKRLFLNSINDVVAKSVHTFTYNNPEGLPARFSYARDTGGYYNGVETNNNLIPKLPNISVSYPGATQDIVPSFSQTGMLTKVVYPTKGNSEFFYENHTRKEYKMITPPQGSGLSLKAESMDTDVTNPNVTNTGTFTSIRNEEVVLGGSASFNSTKCDPQLQVQGKHKAVVRLSRPGGELIPFYTKSTNGSQSLVGTSYVLPGNGTAFYAQIPKDEQLKLSVTTSFECTRSSASVSYTTAEAVYGDVETELPGVRIKKITSNPNDGPSVSRTFIYKDIGEQFANASVAREPVFNEGLSKTKTCVNNPAPGQTGGSIPYGVERFTYYALTSSNINQLNALHPNIYYKTVQEKMDGRSTIIHNYSIETDYFGKLLYGDPIKSAPWTNFGWSNGRELLTKYLDADNKLVRTVENIYEEDQARKAQVDGFAIRKNYDNPVVQNVSKTCKAEDLDDQIEATYCTTNHHHLYSTTDLYKNCHASGANNVTNTYKSLCYGKNVGDVVTYDNTLDNLDVMQYKNISRFDYLKYQKTTDYFGGTPVKTEVQYMYGNPLHHQLTGKKIIHPDLALDESVYKFAHEKGNQLMIAKNMVALPLETVSTQTSGTVTKTISRTEALYPTSLPTSQSGNLLLPLSEKSYDKLGTGSYTDITYDKYDAKGNILQYTTDDGTPVSFIYGYNDTEVIAKVEGMKYDDLVAAVSPASIVSASNDDASDPSKENLLLDALNSFRKEDLLKDKLVTTYTHDPLIGVTSITPPSGIREIYLYDTAGRLKEVKAREKDAAGSFVLRTIKNYNYNYKP